MDFAIYFAPMHEGDEKFYYIHVSWWYHAIHFYRLNAYLVFNRNLIRRIED